MSHKTAIVSDFNCYQASEDDTSNGRSEQCFLRELRLRQFPHPVMLQVAFPELDFINRWCWVNFGSRDDECTQQDSEYRVCQIDEPHTHSGHWTDHWFVKTDYNFGFNEWYFANESDYKIFAQNIPGFNWGEHYTKK